jgi:hypothetical protein
MRYGLVVFYWFAVCFSLQNVLLAQAQTLIYVDAINGNDANAGTSAATAVATPSAAVTKCGTAVCNVFVMTDLSVSAMVVVGTNTQMRWQPYTIARNLTCTSSNHPFFQVRNADSFSLSGLSISSCGGAVLAFSSPIVTIDNCDFRSHSNSSLIFFGLGGVASISNSVFLNNTAAYGSAIAAVGSATSIVTSNCTFMDNSATVAGTVFMKTASQYNDTGSLFMRNASPVRAATLFFETLSYVSLRGSTIRDLKLVKIEVCALIADGVKTFVMDSVTIRDNVCQTIALVRSLQVVLTNVTFERNAALYTVLEILYSDLASANTIVVNNSRFLKNAAFSNGDSPVVMLRSTYRVYVYDSVFANNVGCNYGALGLFCPTIAEYGTVFDPTVFRLFRTSFVNNSNYDAPFKSIAGLAASGGAVNLLVLDPRAGVYFADCVFTRNTASSGGAIAARGPVEMVRCDVYNNIATATAGGALLISSDLASVIIRQSRFIANRATPYASEGGAIWGPFANNSLIEDSIFANNSASVSGGAIKLTAVSGVLYSTIVLIRNVTFVSNVLTDQGQGGAIHIESHYVIKFQDLPFLSNYATIGLFGQGGAVYVVGSVITFNNVTFRNNYALPAGNRLGYGGAVFMFTHALSFFTDCLFEDNGISPDNLYSLGSGGCIWSQGGLELVRTRLVRCSAFTSGGAVHLGGGGLSTSIISSIFENCTSWNQGGAIFADILSGVGIVINSSLFLGNSVTQVGAQGGALFLQFSNRVQVWNSTFQNSRGAALGGAVYSAAIGVSFLNSWFIGNVASQGGAVLAFSFTLCAFANYVDGPVLLPDDANYYQSNVVTAGGGAIFYSDLPRTGCNTTILSRSYDRLFPLTDKLIANNNSAVFGIAAATPPATVKAKFVSGVTPPVRDLPSRIFAFPGETFYVSGTLYDAFGQVSLDQVSAAGVIAYPWYGNGPSFSNLSKAYFATGVTDALTTAGSVTFSVSLTAGVSNYSIGVGSIPFTLLSAMGPVVTVLPCPPGTRVGAGTCIPCTGVEYTTATNSPACYPCSDLTRSDRGECAFGGRAVFSHAGWYLYPVRSSRGRADLIQCLQGHCAGTSASSIPPQESGIINTCREGQTGFLCGSCVKGWSYWGQECVDCATEERWIVFAFIVIGFVYVIMQHISAQGSGSGMKIIISFLQLAAAIEQSGPLGFINLRLSAGTSCPFSRSIPDVFWTDLLTPFFLFLSLVILTFLVTLFKKTGMQNRFSLPIRTALRFRAFRRSALLLFLLVYSSLSSLAITFLSCSRYPSGDFVLTAFPGLSCDSFEYTDGIRPVASLLLALSFLSPVSILAGLIVLVRKKILILRVPLGLTTTKWSYALGPLFESYRTGSYWYEAFFLLRRLILSAVPALSFAVLEESVPYATPLIRCMLVALYLAIHIWLRPFDRPSDNTTETVALFTLMVMTITSAIRTASGTASNGADVLSVLFYLLYALFAVFGATYFGYDAYRTWANLRKRTTINDIVLNPAYGMEMNVMEADKASSFSSDFGMGAGMRPLARKLNSNSTDTQRQSSPSPSANDNPSDVVSNPFRKARRPAAHQSNPNNGSSASLLADRNSASPSSSSSSSVRGSNNKV